MIYLDNAATSYPKAPGVSAAVAACLDSLPGSTGRSSHPLAIEATRRLFDLRCQVAAFLGIEASERLVFTKNATEALNLVIFGSVPPGGRVLCSSLEHNAVMRPLRLLEATRGLRLDIFRVDAAGNPDDEALREGLSQRPDLLVVTAASNVTGAILPIAEMAALSRNIGVPSLVDGSQLVGHRRIDLSELGVDYFAFSGHKGLLGPAGTGGLYLAPGRSPEALIHGGTGSASSDELQPHFLPDRYEAGTPNLAALAGLGEALVFLTATGIKPLALRETALTQRLEEGLSHLHGIAFQGGKRAGSHLPLLSCTCDTMPEREIAQELGARGIAVRVGLHCSPAAHRSLGSFERGGTLRFSPGFMTTEDEIDACITAMKEILS